MLSPKPVLHEVVETGFCGDSGLICTMAIGRGVLQIYQKYVKLCYQWIKPAT